MRARDAGLLLVIGLTFAGSASSAAPAPYSTAPPVRHAAAQGDNCTPFDGFKIGYSLELEPRYRAGRIVNQSTVLVLGRDGSKVAGWILLTFAGDRWFTPRTVSTLPSSLDKLPAGRRAADDALAELTHARKSALSSIACFDRPWSPP